MGDVDDFKHKLELKKEALDRFFEATSRLGVDIPPYERSLAYFLAAINGDPMRFLGDVISNIQTMQAEKKIPKPEAKDEDDELARIISEMLWENTGVHFLDSGGAYGRHWEQNRQIKSFKDTPQVYLDISKLGDGSLWISASINIFWFLYEFLYIDDFSRKLNRYFDEFAERPENRRLSWWEVLEKFTAELQEKGFEGLPFIFVERDNTYNFDNYLSQGFYYEMYAVPDRRYEPCKSCEFGIDKENCRECAAEGDAPIIIVVSIHNGCDIRGGYTKPRFFWLADPYGSGHPYFDFFDSMRRIFLDCDCAYITFSWDFDAYGMKTGDGKWIDDTSKEEIKEHINKYGLFKFWEIDIKNKRLICRRCGKEVRLSF
ncbi:MAG: hypothetical protein Q6363_005765 [Candidatus Njordarchaeota archaeon]